MILQVLLLQEVKCEIITWVCTSSPIAPAAFVTAKAVHLCMCMPNLLNKSKAQPKVIIPNFTCHNCTCACTWFLWLHDIVLSNSSTLCKSQSFRYTVLPRLSVPRLSETSIIRTQLQTWSLFKIMVFSLKSQTLRRSRVHTGICTYGFVCHTYMSNVGTQWYVIVNSVK